MNKPDILAALSPLIETFKTIGIEYHIGGSIASSAYGVARATMDIDVVADMIPKHAPLLTQSLQDRYYIEETMIRTAIERRSSFNVIHLDTLLKIDVFILKNTPYDRLAFARKHSDKLVEGDDSSFFNFASGEDVILNKLLWFRLGEEVSDRQWFDVLGVLKVQKEALDLEYLRRWARELGISGLLDRAFNDAGIIPENH